MSELAFFFLTKCLHFFNRVFFFSYKPVILGSWSENILQYFLRRKEIAAEDGAEVTWYHAANSKAQLEEALGSKSGRPLALHSVRGSRQPLLDG